LIIVLVNLNSPNQCVCKLRSITNFCAGL